VSVEEEVRGTEDCIPASMGAQYRKQGTLDEGQKNHMIVRGKTRKMKVLTANGSITNTINESGSSDSLNSGIQQGNVRSVLNNLQ